MFARFTGPSHRIARWFLVGLGAVTLTATVACAAAPAASASVTHPTCSSCTWGSAVSHH
ncbi:MAG TPA: hypothetical protein VGS19_35050 [Streptosporangiaceae bacterium]|nr:hypothetical protein [Streptosporangiaceae bacterium]